MIEKLIGAHHIMIFVCQGSPSPPSVAKKAPGGPKKLAFYQIWCNIGMRDIKINLNDTETHWNTSYYEICMSGFVRGPLYPQKMVLGPLRDPKNCDLMKYDGNISMISIKINPIGTHHIIRFVWQGLLSPLWGPKKLWWHIMRFVCQGTPCLL